MWLRKVIRLYFCEGNVFLFSMKTNNTCRRKLLWKSYIMCIYRVWLSEEGVALCESASQIWKETFLVQTEWIMPFHLQTYSFTCSGDTTYIIKLDSDNVYWCEVYCRWNSAVVKHCRIKIPGGQAERNN